MFATSAVAIAALLVLGSGRLVSNRQVAENSLDENMFDLNVEALADGEGGTPVRQCYSDGADGKYDWYIKCEEITSPQMIYPCPPNSTYMCAGASSYCTTN